MITSQFAGSNTLLAVEVIRPNHVNRFIWTGGSRIASEIVKRSNPKSPKINEASMEKTAHSIRGLRKQIRESTAPRFGLFDNQIIETAICTQSSLHSEYHKIVRTALILSVGHID